MCDLFDSFSTRGTDASFFTKSGKAHSLFRHSATFLQRNCFSKNVNFKPLGFQVKERAVSGFQVGAISKAPK